MQVLRGRTPDNIASAVKTDNDILSRNMIGNSNRKVSESVRVDYLDIDVLVSVCSLDGESD